MLVGREQYGQWAGVFPGVQAISGYTHPPPFSATPLAKWSVMPATFPGRTVRISSWLQSRYTTNCTICG